MKSANDRDQKFRLSTSIVFELYKAAIRKFPVDKNDKGQTSVFSKSLVIASRPLLTNRLWNLSPMTTVNLALPPHV
jgi:hypothetical protein